jgi:hypothetical protein
LLITVVLAFKSRNLPSNFNETSFIFACASASLILLFCFQPIYHTVDSGILQMRILNMSILINHTICLCALFLPKVYAVKLPEEGVVSHVTKTMHRRVTMARSHSVYESTESKISVSQRGFRISRTKSKASVLLSENEIFLSPKLFKRQESIHIRVSKKSIASNSVTATQSSASPLPFTSMSSSTLGAALVDGKKQDDRTEKEETIIAKEHDDQTDKDEIITGIKQDNPSEKEEIISGTKQDDRTEKEETIIGKEHHDRTDKDERLSL